MKAKYSIIVPVYNEQESVPLFVEAINPIMNNLNEEYEIIFVNDGSKDNTLNILKNYGVIEIDGNNKPFDPTYHEAIMTEKRDGVQSGMVLEVLQKGYILKDRVIRPAMVKVSE